MSRFYTICLIASLVSLMTGCGFHPRSRSDLSANLTSIYISTPPNYYGTLTENINVFFNSMKINTRDTASPSTLTLAFTHIKFTSSTDTLSSSSSAMNTQYKLILEVQLIDYKQNEISEKHPILVQKSQQQNTSQIITQPKQSLYQNEMNREAIDAMYQWLASKTVTNDINNYYRKANHATTHKTT